jgi:biotin transport system substrate-specific component
MTSSTASSSAARTDARRIAITALLAALLAASALFTVPIHPVPLTLQVFMVVLIALLVPPAWACLAVGTYLLVGAIGLPVFAHLMGGIHVLLGPTGGYLFGFLAGAVAGSWVRGALERAKASRIVADAAAAAVVIGVIHVLGWAQLAVVTGMGAFPALVAGVAPFILLDALKAVAAVAVVSGARRAARL